MWTLPPLAAALLLVTFCGAQAYDPYAAFLQANGQAYQVRGQHPAGVPVIQAQALPQGYLVGRPQQARTWAMPIQQVQVPPTMPGGAQPMYRATQQAPMPVYGVQQAANPTIPPTARSFAGEAGPASSQPAWLGNPMQHFMEQQGMAKSFLQGAGGAFGLSGRPAVAAMQAAAREATKPGPRPVEIEVPKELVAGVPGLFGPLFPFLGKHPGAALVMEIGLVQAMLKIFSEGKLIGDKGGHPGDAIREGMTQLADQLKLGTRMEALREASPFDGSKLATMGEKFKEAFGTFKEKLAEMPKLPTPKMPKLGAAGQQMRVAGQALGLDKPAAVVQALGLDKPPAAVQASQRSLNTPAEPSQRAAGSGPGGAVPDPANPAVWKRP